jgi:hypothetical protein
MRRELAHRKLNLTVFLAPVPRTIAELRDNNRQTRGTQMFSLDPSTTFFQNLMLSLVFNNFTVMNILYQIKLIELLQEQQVGRGFET